MSCGRPVVEQGSVMNVLVRVSHGSGQHSAQQALALWRAFEEELAHSGQQRQPHRHRLIRKSAPNRLQQVWSVLFIDAPRIDGGSLCSPLPSHRCLL